MYEMYFNRRGQSGGQSAGQGSVCSKPNLAKRVLPMLVMLHEAPGAAFAGTVAVLGPLQAAPTVGCVLWQLPQHRWGLQGASLMGSARVPALREERIIAGKWQFYLICVSFLVLLWQPVKWIICLKGREQVIAGSAEVCLAYRCLLGSTGGPGGGCKPSAPSRAYSPAE